jgi:formate-dependent nitrite reductase membrane component NrfD
MSVYEMDAYQWMKKKNRRQTEWIEKRGLFLWLAIYTGGLGGGLYLVSLLFNSLPGMVVSLLIIAVLKGGTHLLFLGKPWRFWRIMFRPQTSWLSRGFLFVVFFVGISGLKIIATYAMQVGWIQGSTWTTIELSLKILAGVMALGLTTYTGFVLNYIKAIPFWNSPLLPLLFVMCALLGGFGLMVAISLNIAAILAAAEAGSRILLLLNVLLIIIYLWRASKRQEAGKKSVTEQIRGDAAPVFWIGVVILGIIVPLIIAVISQFNHISPVLLIAGVACEIIGGLSLRYSVLKVGIYNSVIPLPAYANS